MSDSASKPLVGTKNGSGVWQRIVSLMPPHRVYIEPFWGRGSVAKRKLPAAATIGIDLDPAAVASGASCGLMFLADGLQWLKDYFRLRSTAAGYCGADRAATFGDAPWQEHLVYLDPPYLIDRNYYRFNLTPEQHADLLAVFKALPCPALLSGYMTPLYRRLLAGYESTSIPTITRGGKRVLEIVWQNFPRPELLHDCRYIGRNRRERERIQRRVRNWQRNFSQMAPLERQAVLQALAASSSDAAGRVAVPGDDSSTNDTTHFPKG